MKKLILTAAALMIAVAAHAQGAFTFNTRNLTAANVNNIRFTDGSGAFLTGSDYFIQVFAGPAAQGVAGLQPLASTLPLNRTGTGAGWPNPFQQTFSTTMAGGTDALVGYAAYQGTSWDTATLKSAIITTRNGGAATDLLTVTLQAPPNVPSEVFLGTGTVAIPEPSTLALGVIGLGALLAYRRRR